MALFIEKKKILKFVGKYKRAQTAKETLRKKEKAEKNHTSWFQIILQSCGNQNGMVLW